MPEIKVEHSLSPLSGKECTSAFLNGVQKTAEYSSDIPTSAKNKSQKDRYIKLSKVFKELKALVSENGERGLKIVTAFLVKYTNRIPTKDEIELFKDQIDTFQSIKQFNIPLKLSVKDSVKFICNDITKHLNDVDLNKSEAKIANGTLKPLKKNILRKSMANASMPDLQTIKVPYISTILDNRYREFKKQFAIPSNFKISKLKDVRKEVLASGKDFAFSPLPSIVPMRGAESPKELSKFKVVRQSLDLS